MSGSIGEGTAAKRLSQVAATITGGTGGSSILSLPWNPDSTSFPTRKELPSLGDNVPEGAAWVWGSDDQIGRINLLTPTRVAEAAKTNIKDGDIVSLKYLFPSPPSNVLLTAY